jgi:hypothetical protein
MSLDDPRRRNLALVACAISRTNPGSHLDAGLEEPDPLVRARACRAAGELGRKDLLGELTSLLPAENDDLRFLGGMVSKSPS